MLIFHTYIHTSMYKSTELHKLHTKHLFIHVMACVDIMRVHARYIRACAYVHTCIHLLVTKGAEVSKIRIDVV